MELKDLLKSASKQLRADFEACRLLPHAGVKGQELENAVKRFLNEHLPSRFSAVSGFILDTSGNISPHLDVIVYDQLYAPTYRYSEQASVVPNDSVAAVIEVKARLNKQGLLEAMDRSKAVKALVKNRIGITLDVDYRGCVTEASEVEMDGMARTMFYLFTFQSDIALETVLEHWHKHYQRVPLGWQIDEILVLDSAVLGHFFNDPRIHERAAVLAPHVGALGWETFMGASDKPAVFGFPTLHFDPKAKELSFIDPDTKEFQYTYVKVEGMQPDTSVYLGITELEEESLDAFFRSLVTYLMLFRRGIFSPGGPRPSNISGIRSKALPLGFVISTQDVQQKGLGKALFDKFIESSEVAEAGLDKYVKPSASPKEQEHDA